MFDVAQCSVPASTIAAGDQWPEGSTFEDFSCTIDLCNQLNLPIVDYKQATLSVDNAWAWLLQLPDAHYTGIEAPLEGYVVRAVGCGDRVAKLRAEYLSSRAESGREWHDEPVRSVIKPVADLGRCVGSTKQLQHQQVINHYRHFPMVMRLVYAPGFSASAPV